MVDSVPWLTPTKFKSSQCGFKSGSLYLLNLFIVYFLFRLELLEAGAKDASQFLEWQRGMKQKDMDEQLADIERRRLEGKISHEEAILARQSLIKDNRQKVQEMKEEVGWEPD